MLEIYNNNNNNNNNVYHSNEHEYCSAREKWIPQ
jgi:hypothetical protein